MFKVYKKYKKGLKTAAPALHGGSGSGGGGSGGGGGGGSGVGVGVQIKSCRNVMAKYGNIFCGTHNWPVMR